MSRSHNKKIKRRADRAVSAQGEDRFDVDFSIMRLGKLGAMLRSEQVLVDPQLVAEAVRAVMRRCQVKDARGGALVWNEYKLFLARSDHEGLRPLEPRLNADLPGLLHEELLDISAELVGDLTVRLLIDEAGDVPKGGAAVRVAFLPSKDLADPSDGEVTVRLTNKRPGAAGITQRIADPLGGSGAGVELLWSHGHRFIPIGTRVLLGRHHPEPPPNFVPLMGAGKTINKRQAWIEPAESGVVIGRMSNANPVQVNGHLVQPGGQLQSTELPLRISLSNGELILTLRKPELP